MLNRIITENLDAQQIINEFKKLPVIAEELKRVVRHYKIEHHTKLVILQFEKYFFNVKWPVSNNLFKTLLVLHDVGKPRAFSEGNINNQYSYTIEIIDKIAEKLPFTKEEICLLKNLVNGDPIGLYLQGRSSVESAVAIISENGKRTNISIKDFFKLLTIYYQCDAGSYTKDAGGIRFLEHLFQYKEGQKVYSSQHQRIIFSSMTEEKFTKLEMHFR